MAEVDLMEALDVKALTTEEYDALPHVPGTVAITGHRPEKIDDMQWVEIQLRYAYGDLRVEKVIQGMAAGVDLISAKVAYKSDIPFVCARPWAGHGPRREWRKYYEQALQNAAQVVNVTKFKKYPAPWVYQIRNEWMVDRSNGVIAIWDGSPGGTANCVNYAIKQNYPIYQINPLTREMEWLRGKALQV